MFVSQCLLFISFLFHVFLFDFAIEIYFEFNETYFNFCVMRLNDISMFHFLFTVYLKKPHI